MLAQPFPDWQRLDRHPVGSSDLSLGRKCPSKEAKSSRTDWLRSVLVLTLSVVFLVTDNTLNPILNPTEVIHLFSMPLPAFLHHRPSQIPGWHFGLSSRIPPDHDPAVAGPPPKIPYAKAAKMVKAKAVLEDGEDEDEEEDVIGGKEGRYYQYRDVPWGEGRVRMHRFLTGREGGGVKPVYGLTA